ncbi:hypothetical protein [Mesorhizobium sp. A556]
MAKQLTHTYTPERLEVLDKAKLETLRANAERLDAQDLVAMCDFELNSRKPAPRRSATVHSARHEGDVVLGYHFVCGRDLGVSVVGDGNFWSGSWVVAERNVEMSISAGAYLALHESKAEPSYRQGKIIGYRKAPRDMVAKRNEGIEFLVETFAQPMNWVGDGAGEKGYHWASLKAGEKT